MWTKNYRTMGRGAGETTQSMKYLFHKHKDCSSILRSHISNARCGRTLSQGSRDKWISIAQQLTSLAYAAITRLVRYRVSKEKRKKKKD